MSGFLRFIVLLLCVFVSLPICIQAQVRPVNDYGALGLGHLLKRLNTTASVMMIGAHPDDEDSALLAYLARGEGARTAYLSLTRGEGGQNLIGPELGEALGIIRTEELLQARRLDGAEQYFTRAYDFGFSKTLAETKSKWPEDVIKCDVVRAIRLFRPMVVISRFTGTPADGHGHHQYAGYISSIAVKAAADPKQCTDAGESWQVLKFYVGQSFRDTSQPTLRINTGQYDPLLGRTYFEIAMEGRSQHRSQGEGRLELHGDQFSGLKLIETQTRPGEKENSIFDGIDTHVSAVDDVLGVSERPNYADLAKARESINNARTSYRPAAASDTVGALGNILTALRSAARSRNRAPSAVFLLNKKIEECIAALRIAAGVQIDVLADRETVAPGENIFVSVKAYLAKEPNYNIKQIDLSVPAKWNVTKADAPKNNEAAFIRRETATAADYFSVSVSRDEKPTAPYWLEFPRKTSDLFVWTNALFATYAFDPPPVVAHVKIEMATAEVIFDQPVQYRFADPPRGEVRRDINVVPPITLDFDKSLVIVPYNDRSETRRVNVLVRKNSGLSVMGNIQPLSGWKVSPTNGAFELKRQGETGEFAFDITIPPRPSLGARKLSAAVVREDHSIPDFALHVITYPHIQTHRYYTWTHMDLLVVDLKIEPVRVGYIMGSGDEVPDAIRQMGMEVAMLEEKELASGDLSRFDTIVVGIRASETRPDLSANNARLLEYVKNGGTVIMQYQRGNWTGLAPFPVDTQDKQGTAAGSTNRVVDENAPVKIVAPEHPVFNFPNKITDADFNGWVQERNAYNLVTFDPQYTPLLESHDAGEQENKGGLVIAKVGKGNWVYCSYSFFRQLPAGVPGAYRLFANLLSLPKVVAEARTW